MLGAASCTDEVEYTAADNVVGEGFYLSDTGTADISIEENATSVTIPVYRTNSEGVASVSIESSIVDENGNPVTGIFSVPDKVTFADGATETGLNVSFDFDKIEALAEYTLTVKLLTDQLTEYATAECTYTLSYAPWTPWYYYSITDPGFYQQASLWSYGYDCPVYIRYSLVDNTTVQIGVPSPFSDLDYTLTITLNVSPENLYNPDNQTNQDLDYIESLTDDDVIDITKLKMNYYVYTNKINTTIVNTNYNKEMWFTDSYTYWTSERGLSKQEAIAQIEANDQFRSFFNPVAGKFSLCIVPYIEGLGYFPTSVGTETLQLPGNFKEYTMSLTYSGNMVTPDGTESAIISLTRSKDIVTYTYKVFGGALTDEEIAAEIQKLANDKDAEFITEDNIISITPDEPGKYTVIAVGFDSSSNYVASTSLTFTYESVQKENEWETLGICEYTDGFMTAFTYVTEAETMEVEIQEHKETNGLYRLVNPYKNWSFLEDGDLLDGNYYITIDATDPDGVWILQGELGLNVYATYGDLIGWSDAGYEIQVNGATVAQCKAAGITGTLKDGIITFPAKGLLLGLPGTNQIVYANAEEVDLVDMSYISARAPMKAAANRHGRTFRKSATLNAGNKSEFKRCNTIATKTISHDDYVKYALKHIKY